DRRGQGAAGRGVSHDDPRLRYGWRDPADVALVAGEPNRWRRRELIRQRAPLFDTGAVASVLRERADGAIAEGKDELAVGLLDEAYEHEPDPDTGLRLGELLLGLGRAGDARRILVDVLQPLDPETEIPLDIAVAATAAWRRACVALAIEPDP